MKKRVAFILILLSILTFSCKKEKEKEKEIEEVNPPEIVVSKENKNLVFSYIDKDGNFKDTQNIDEIPEESRKQVIVFDTSIPPEKRLSHKIIYIADLTRPTSDGRYRYTIASRYEFDSALREGISQFTPTTTTDQKDQKSIIIYTTSWCGVCAQLKRYLNQMGIAYVEKDIEKSEENKNEMLQKLRAKGLRGSGVPVIDINGEIIVGFNKELLDEKLKR